MNRLVPIRSARSLPRWRMLVRRDDDRRSQARKSPKSGTKRRVTNHLPRNRSACSPRKDGPRAPRVPRSQAHACAGPRRGRPARGCAARTRSVPSTRRCRLSSGTSSLGAWERVGDGEAADLRRALAARLRATARAAPEVLERVVEIAEHPFCHLDAFTPRAGRSRARRSRPRARPPDRRRSRSGPLATWPGSGG
jgi:hypothetical protein